MRSTAAPLINEPHEPTAAVKSLLTGMALLQQQA